MAADRASIERFLIREARLMDEHRYDEWLALWSLDNSVYWIPANADDIDPARNVSIIYDRGGQLRNRIQRLKETSWLKEQAPKLKRLVSNVEIEAESADEIEVSAAFLITELHRHRQYTWTGTSIYKLVPDRDEFRIKYKKVLLLNNNEPIPNLMFLV